MRQRHGADNPHDQWTALRSGGNGWDLGLGIADSHGSFHTTEGAHGQVRQCAIFRCSKAIPLASYRTRKIVEIQGDSSTPWSESCLVNGLQRGSLQRGPRMGSFATELAYRADLDKLSRPFKRAPVSALV
ncbi:hypothetical protein D3C84_847350 [compost metagenome]